MKSISRVTTNCILFLMLYRRVENTKCVTLVKVYSVCGTGLMSMCTGCDIKYISSCGSCSQKFEKHCSRPWTLLNSVFSSSQPSKAPRCWCMEPRVKLCHYQGCQLLLQRSILHLGVECNDFITRNKNIITSSYKGHS